MKVRDLLNDKN
jgi:hypothetical protein